MLKIGEFSILSSISINMLRHYDEIGLLLPYQVDKFTGYRYYSEEQLLTANRIQALKAMGYGLKDIIEVLKQGLQAESFRKLLEAKETEKKNEVRLLQKQLKQIEKSRKEIDNKEEFTCCISMKTIPQRKIVSHRFVIKEFSEEGTLWKVLITECSKQNVQFAVPEYAIAIEYVVDLEKNYIDTEIQRAVDKLYQDTDTIKFTEVAPVLVASLTYQGGYSRINEINPYIAKWILENQYEICGAAFNIYHISPENEENEDNFITEVCFPIKNRE